jgi:CRP-like cAMP-binding protein
METSAVGSTQPRLRGAALRNLAKATRPVVVSRQDQPAYWRSEPTSRQRSAVSGTAAQVLRQSGSAIARAIRSLAPEVAPAAPKAATSHPATPRRKIRKKEDELSQLADAARYSAILNRFEAIAPLNDEERAVLQKLDFAQRRVHQAGSDIVDEGEQPPPMLVVSGWASRIRVLSSGRRQILGLLVPSDGVGLHREAEPISAATITAITTVETVDASALLEAAFDAERYPGIALAMERIAAQENAFSDNQILRLGALSAVRRVAHLCLELQWRLGEVQLGNNRAFPLPLTHETIADTLGMEPTDVRRALKVLRSRRMFDLRYGRINVLSKRQLDLGGDFRPPEIIVREGSRPATRH